MTPDHIKKIRRFYMDLLDKNGSIFHQAHCEEMVALCNQTLRLEEELRVGQIAFDELRAKVTPDGVCHSCVLQCTTGPHCVATEPS